MSYDINKFVNTNKANVRFSNDEAQSDFEQKIAFDNVNAQAFPVLVYEMKTKAIAWYDTEMSMGFAM